MKAGCGSVCELEFTLKSEQRGQFSPTCLSWLQWSEQVLKVTTKNSLQKRCVPPVCALTCPTTVHPMSAQPGTPCSSNLVQNSLSWVRWYLSYTCMHYFQNTASVHYLLTYIFFASPFEFLSSLSTISNKTLNESALFCSIVHLPFFPERSNGLWLVCEVLKSTAADSKRRSNTRISCQSRAVTAPWTFSVLQLFQAGSIQQRVSCKEVVRKSSFCPKVTGYFVRPDDMTAWFYQDKSNESKSVFCNLIYWCHLPTPMNRCSAGPH